MRIGKVRCDKRSAFTFYFLRNDRSGKGRSFSLANLNNQTSKTNQYQTKLKQL